MIPRPPEERFQLGLVSPRASRDLSGQAAVPIIPQKKFRYLDAQRKAEFLDLIIDGLPAARRERCKTPEESDGQKQFKKEGGTPSRGNQGFS